MSRFPLTLVFCGGVLVACGARPQSHLDAGEQPDASFEVDAGRPRGSDPASGWQVAVPLPPTAAPSSKLGVHVASVGDRFGQPLIAAQYEDPNGDSNFDDNRVVFTRWDGIAQAFTEAQTIEVVGGAAFERPDRQVSIATDPATGRIAVAYVKGQNNTVRLAISDDEGANFSLATISVSGVSETVSNPVVALAGSVTHLAWLQGSEVKYVTRESGATTSSMSPGAVVVQGRSLSMALDGSRHPGLAFFVAGPMGETALAFWRPGSPPSQVTSSQGVDLTVSDRRPSVSLVFANEIPHVAYHLRMTEPLPMADDSTELWYGHATDAAGTTWAAPVAIQRNSGMGSFQTTAWYQALSFGSGTEVLIAADYALSHGSVTLCGGPKLARSSDGLSFMTCAPKGSMVQTGGDWVSMWPHSLGKQTLVFYYDTRANPNLRGGIVMWREP